jgi:hydrogenase maturation protein HypF
VTVRDRGSAEGGSKVAHMMRPPDADTASEAGGADERDGADERETRDLVVHGLVQGVGFRPFVYRLAHELCLDGVVRNTAGRVEIRASGAAGHLDMFAARLASDAPPRSRVERVSVAASPIVVPPGSGFVVEESVAGTSTTRLFPPDIATCDACLAELVDPADRRYRYPFINCTDCGPRATIIEELPYDRAQTSMRDFPLCDPCRAEYRDPGDRRFHAEPVACPTCGPQLAWRSTSAPAPTARGEAALRAAVVAIAAGHIVAVKGLGGYHLACDATDEDAVTRLRDRKRRWAKPFAVMVRDLDAARSLAIITDAEARLMTTPARPIVLVRARPQDGAGHEAGSPLAPAVGLGDRRVGLFLPYTPLHHLLLAALERPIVLTSGNLSDEPLAIDDADAATRLAGIADGYLLHDRRIRARYDDSVTRVVGTGAGARESMVRRGRGYAPEPLPLPVAMPEGQSALAAGAELKHTFALAIGARAHIAPHTGDLEDLATHQAYEGNRLHLERLLAVDPSWVVHDLHPGYLSTQDAVRRFPAERRIGVQHHHAHVASCAAEHGVTGPFLGLAYDGLGMGDDGTFWGGELLLADLVSFRRLARFGRAPMPGGASAIKRPYRMALGYIFAAEGTAGLWERAVRDGLADAYLARLDAREVEIVRLQVARQLNAPVASSAGRLFDAASSLLGLRDVAEFEAQAAIDLENAADPLEPGTLPWQIDRVDGLLVLDPRPTLLALMEGIGEGIRPGVLATRFQRTITEATRELAADARSRTGVDTVCISGGVFQNAWLADTLLEGLARDGFVVHINEQVPVNDGGISYGQAAIGAARLGAGAGHSGQEG